MEYCCVIVDRYPGEMMSKSTKSGCIGDCLKAVGLSLQRPLHRWVFSCMLQADERVYLAALPKACPAGYRRLGGLSLLCLRFLCKCAHE